MSYRRNSNTQTPPTVFPKNLLVFLPFSVTFHGGSQPGILITHINNEPCVSDMKAQSWLKEFGSEVRCSHAESADRPADSRRGHTTCQTNCCA